MLKHTRIILILKDIVLLLLISELQSGFSKLFSALDDNKTVRRRTA
jgi:hypothetical protein